MKTRIDIISGPFQAGKSDLISRMLQSGACPGGRIVSAAGPPGAPLADALVPLLAGSRPSRLLLELPGDMPLAEAPALLRAGALSELAYPGTRAFVMDGSAFLGGGAPAARCLEQVRHASLVFVNRAEPLGVMERLEVLRRIWEANARVQLFVEPLHGIDLWRVFDLPDGTESQWDNQRRAIWKVC